MLRQTSELVGLEIVLGSRVAKLGGLSDVVRGPTPGIDDDESVVDEDSEDSKRVHKMRREGDRGSCWNRKLMELVRFAHSRSCT